MADSGAAKSVLRCAIRQRSGRDCADPAAGEGGALGSPAAPCGLWARPHSQAPPHQLPPCASTAHALCANPSGEHSLNASLDDLHALIIIALYELPAMLWHHTPRPGL